MDKKGGVVSTCWHWWRGARRGTVKIIKKERAALTAPVARRQVWLVAHCRRGCCRSSRRNVYALASCGLLLAYGKKRRQLSCGCFTARSAEKKIKQMSGPARFLASCCALAVRACGTIASCRVRPRCRLSVVVLLFMFAVALPYGGHTREKDMKEKKCGEKSLRTCGWHPAESRPCALLAAGVSRFLLCPLLPGVCILFCKLVCPRDSRRLARSSVLFTIQRPRPVPVTTVPTSWPPASSGISARSYAGALACCGGVEGLQWYYVLKFNVLVVRFSDLSRERAQSFARRPLESIVLDAHTTD